MFKKDCKKCLSLKKQQDWKINVDLSMKLKMKIKMKSKMKLTRKTKDQTKIQTKYNNTSKLNFLKLMKNWIRNRVDVKKQKRDY